MKHKPLSRTQLGMQIYDTMQPDEQNRMASIRAIERHIGLKHPNLLVALRRRELAHEMKCPTCGLVPGQKLSLKKAKQLRDALTQRKEN